MLLESLSSICRDAGQAILRHYHSGLEVDYKDDQSPLTAADRASHELISRLLYELTPEIPVLSEESAEIPLEERLAWGRFWLVDPLDGTKEFIKKTGEFTVNIALIENRRPVVGFVYAPALDVLYYAESGGQAWIKDQSSCPRPLRVARAQSERLQVVASKDHAGPEVEALLKKLPGARLKSMGSSLKFCLVAAGEADLYPRFVPTMEWDTAAAQCILEEAGGALYTLDGAVLSYQKRDLRNPSVIAVGDARLDWKSLLP